MTADFPYGTGISGRVTAARPEASGSPTWARGRDPPTKSWQALGNFAVLSVPVDHASARAAVEPLADSAMPSAVLFPGMEVPTGIAAYLAERGYVSQGALPAMGVDISRLKSTALPDGYECVRVSTIPEERRKGLGEHATAEPLRAAMKLGYGVGVLQSSEAGYRVYRKLGFTDFGGVPIFVRVPR